MGELLIFLDKVNKRWSTALGLSAPAFSGFLSFLPGYLALSTYLFYPQSMPPFFSFLVCLSVITGSLRPGQDTLPTCMKIT